MMDIATQAVHSVARFSDCRKYRWDLVRHFTAGKGMINFIMLNPSTANEEFNDPTVARCENRAIEGGFAQMVVTNIFAYRATDPQEMRAANDPVGQENDTAILTHAREADMVICAWGNHGQLHQRGEHVASLLRGLGRPLHYLKLNANGHPAHPLYLRKDLVPAIWL